MEGRGKGQAYVAASVKQFAVVDCEAGGHGEWTRIRLGERRPPAVAVAVGPSISRPVRDNDWFQNTFPARIAAVIVVSSTGSLSRGCDPERSMQVLHDFPLQMTVGQIGAPYICIHIYTPIIMDSAMAHAWVFGPG